MNAKNMTNLSVIGKNVGVLPVPSSVAAPGVNDFSPLGLLPFASHRQRKDSGVRDRPGFFAALAHRLLGRDRGEAEAGLYPWETLPLLIAVHRGQVLVAITETGSRGNELPIPLNLADFYSLKAQHWLTYSQSDRHRDADLLFAGVLKCDGEKTPVLALTGGFERFLEFGAESLNLQGCEQRERAIVELLATQTGGQWVSVRDYAAYGYEGRGAAFAWGEPLSAAVALANWHSSSGFDPATGEPTYAKRAGWVRVTDTGRELFPRTDPAVITAVISDVGGEQKLLLGQARTWGRGRFSTFAGFVEGGESLEDALLREVWEESGGNVVASCYLGSQPWPFPRSLMCGFIARIDNPQEVRADGAEIERVRWFSRSELLAAHSSGEVRLPGPSSISRRLIEYWLGEPLPQI
ncbi:MAG: NAD(+) diphosphatase [Rothia sp. (in: high G+C Gram-positive bacteria)]|nr:NAD(+) diphosphatase [Rothia sp. (in: high G+C Gram-positive bacteria)]